ncbi:MAG: phosphomannomutase/phosphoglucomutase [Candidatus Solincola sediminis]|uniref:Phosphomannomutase/phosphoglucomutase n=1 Tax=Candidatus Solincola sediminis TaxID=1797199 RepID=A0A1F2WI09_9ACTN|nr:MAG: phosphomannomutase/phosphoglucomutase [Candidatus Solincola sediminis]
MKQMNTDIFKAYDVRGIYPEQLDEKTCNRIAKAFVTFIQTDKIVVGYDMRLSSPSLSEAFIEGATEQGADVTLIGLCSTDMLYYASGILDVPGAMFTASHNPKEYNGLKFCRRQAAPISIDTGLADIQDLAIRNEFPASMRRGGVERTDMLDRYIEHALGFIDTSQLKPLKVVADAGNGMGGLILPALFKKLPCELVPHCFEIDGSFPHHQPDPINPQNIKLLQQWVLEDGGDLGMAFDGDADRVFLVDDKGQPVSGSLTTALIARRVLETHGGERIIYNCINGWIVPETIYAFGGIPIKERVGHSFIKQTMAATGAIFAGEHSGHYYFRDNFRADSGLIASLFILEIISLQNQPLSQILEPFKKYFDSGEINSRVDDISAKLEEIAKEYSNGRIEHIDGVTVEYPDWWFNVRPSNTEPLIRLNLEAKTPQLMEAKRDEVLAVIRS